MTLNYLLYKLKLIPRFISVGGFIAAAALLTGSVLSIFELFPVITILLIILIALQEMVFAVWLIIKGFNPAAITSESAKGEKN